MKIMILTLALFGSVAFAKDKKKSRAPASIDAESKMLGELERTLETNAARAEDKSLDEAAILNRPNMQASDRLQYREDY